MLKSILSEFFPCYLSIETFKSIYSMRINNSRSNVRVTNKLFELDLFATKKYKY